MKIVVAKETNPHEHRVALVPASVAQLTKSGAEVLVEAGAGAGALFTDAAYEQAGAKVAGSTQEAWSQADILLKVSPPTEQEVGQLPSGSTIISFMNPLGNPQIIEKLATRGVTALSMELVPRISRAQAMDALSSQAGVAGYKAVLVASEALGKFFPMLITAAGAIPPARVLIIGAGVAGLQAIATARRLGASVEAFDIRPAAKEEVQSLGAKFIDVSLAETTTAAGGYASEVSDEAKRHEQEVLTDHVRQSDVVITTAQVPGRKAPLLVSQEMVEAMSPGSVIVDLAAEQGGNVALTEAGKTIDHNGVKIIGPINLPSTVPVHASQLYSKNVVSLLLLIAPKGELKLDFDDEIITNCCVTHEGAIRNERVKAALAAG